ncbi:type II secretion system protein [Salinigranum sp.]|uniref:type II secretion system protein n=1 Tax=Salinigranum sp. TaxID=1966351 RepID=UPI00356B5364
MASTLTRVLTGLARLWPQAVATDEVLDRQLAFLGVPFQSDVVLRAGYTAGLVTALLVGAGGVALGGPVQAAVLAAAAVGTTVVHLVHRGPAALAAVERTRALCAASDLVGRIVLHARLTPAVEPAVVFAARTGSGPLARSLDDHVRRSVGTPATGLDAFAAAWRPWFPALERAADLVTTGIHAPASDRADLFDRARATVVEATQERMTSFAADVRGPATALYAFGVLLPLALVGVLPAAGVAGASVSLTALALGYDVLLPAVLLGASGWLLVRRPATFATPAVPRTHPDAQVPWWRPVLAGLVTAAAFWVAAPAVVGAWAAPVVAVGTGAGAALVVRFRPAVAVRRHARAVEDGLPEALALVGRHVGDGVSVEAAVETVGEDLSTETGAAFAAAAGVQRRLGVTLREAFLGEFGALADLPSPRTRAAASLLAVAAVEGQPASGTIVGMATQLRDLERAERAGRRELAAVSGTLANTAAVFGPLVGGATVALAARIASVETGASLGPAFSVAGLGTVLGGYVLVMAATLTVLATGLESGLDPTRLGYRVGLALLLAGISFLVGVVAAGLLV